MIEIDWTKFANWLGVDLVKAAIYIALPFLLQAVFFFTLRPLFFQLCRKHSIEMRRRYITLLTAAVTFPMALMMAEFITSFIKIK